MEHVYIKKAIHRLFWNTCRYFPEHLLDIPQRRLPFHLFYYFYSQSVMHIFIFKYFYFTYLESVNIVFHKKYILFGNVYLSVTHKYYDWASLYADLIEKCPMHHL